MTIYRALCTELALVLAEEYGVEREFNSGEPLLGTGAIELLARARAALDRSEAEGPTLDHASLIGFAFGREPWATWLRKGGCLESAHCELSDLMLAALAHWGRPTPAPIPVSDRLPGQEDCDTEGRCWFWEHSDERWELLHHTIAQPNWTWIWLPFHALPLPAEDDA